MYSALRLTFFSSFIHAETTIAALISPSRISRVMVLSTSHNQSVPA